MHERMVWNSAPKIRTKTEHLDRWGRGLFGNKLRSWDSLMDLWKDKSAPQYVNARTKGTHGGGQTIYGIAWRLVSPESLQDMYFNEIAPDEQLVTQGEIQQSENFYDLSYNEEKIKMRFAMVHPKCMSGYWNVIGYLKPKVTSESWDDLMDLFDQYPQSVIEFSVYEKCLGHLPGRNMVFWEIRNY